MKKNFITGIISQILMTIFSFARIKLTQMLFLDGIHENGYYVSIYIFAEYFFVIDIALGNYINMYVGQKLIANKMFEFRNYYNRFRQIYEKAVKYLLIITIIIAITLPLISHEYLYESSYIKSVIYIFFVLSSNNDYFRNELQVIQYVKQDAFRYVWEINLVMLIWVVMLLSKNYMDVSFFTIVIVTSISKITLNLIFKYFKYKRYKDIIPPKEKVVLEIDKVGLRKSFITSAIDRISTLTNVPIITIFFTSVYAGYYNSIFFLIATPFVVVSERFIISATTVLNEEYVLGINYNRKVYRTKVDNSMILLFASLGAILLGNMILNYTGLLPSKTNFNLQYIIILMSISMFLNFYFSLIRSILIVENMMKNLLRITIIGTIINIIVTFALINIAGFSSVIYGNISQSVAMILLYFIYKKNIIDIILPTFTLSVIWLVFYVSNSFGLITYISLSKTLASIIFTGSIVGIFIVIFTIIIWFILVKLGMKEKNK